MAFQTEEQRQAAFGAAGIPLPKTTVPKVGEPIPGTNLKYEAEDIANLTSITGGDLTPVAAPKITQLEPIFMPDISGISTEPPKPQEPAPTTDFNKQLEEAMLRISGKEAETAQRTGAATAGYEQQLLDINKQIKMQQVQALKDQEAALKRGETIGFSTGEAERVQRTNAIETLRLSALAENMQGNILFATKQAERAVNLEFTEKERDLRIKRQNIVDNYDSFTSSQKKKADILLAQLDKDDAFVTRQKEDRTRQFNTAMTAAQFGAPMDIQNKMLRARSASEALSIGGFYLGEDYRRKVEQESFQRDLQIATFSLSKDKFNEDVRQFNLQYALTAQKEEYDRLKSLQKQNPVATAEATAEVLQDKISLIDSLLTSSGLRGSVGTYEISRFTPFTPDKAARQEFAAGVTQLVNKETIDTLVALKARGGTLGALSDQERILLQTAATKIGTWEIKKDGIGTGRYAVSEETFKAELTRIKELAIKAKARALGGGPVQTNSEADELRNAGYSEEQIKLLLEL